MTPFEALHQFVSDQRSNLNQNWEDRDVRRAADQLNNHLCIHMLHADEDIWADELEGDYILIISGIVSLHKTQAGESSSSFSRWLRPHMLTSKKVLWCQGTDSWLPDGYLLAITSARYVTMTQAALTSCIENSVILRKIFLSLAAISTESAAEELYLRHQSLPIRLARLLVDLLELEPNMECLPYTHNNLALLVDTYRETITVTLQYLRNEGAIRLHRGRIEVVDYGCLLGLAEIAINAISYTDPV